MSNDVIRTVDYNQITDIDLLLNRQSGTYDDIRNTVRQIISEVRQSGDKALYEYARRFDKAELTRLDVTPDEISNACARVDDKLTNALKTAYANISEFHAAQKQNGFIQTKDGAVMGQKITPLGRVGLYVPGGTASYISSVLMIAVPAIIAGVGEIVMTTPPDENGNISDEILTAANLCGISRIYKTGGAGAVAALAYGTETIPKVDMIAGPGNAYVAEAKREVFGDVNIDMIAGPSDIFVVADHTANPRWIAADMLSQAEHDPLSGALLATHDRQLAADTAAEIERQLKELPRRKTAETAIKNQSLIIITKDISQSIEAANRIAPEHLELCVKEPFALLSAVKNAGSVFMGHYTPEAVGDYIGGPNHTLPTGGTARFFSPLGVDNFVKKSAFLYYTREKLSNDAESIMLIAQAEGLAGHAFSVAVRG